jgi:MOSC domain-containing protein YiiM
MGMMKFPKLFLGSGRIVYYLRMLERGQVGTGDVIQRVTEDPARMSIHEIVRLALADHDNIEAIQRALGIAALLPE